MANAFPTDALPFPIQRSPLTDDLVCAECGAHVMNAMKLVSMSHEQLVQLIEVEMPSRHKPNCNHFVAPIVAPVEPKKSQIRFTIPDGRTFALGADTKWHCMTCDEAVFEAHYFKSHRKADWKTDHVCRMTVLQALVQLSTRLEAPTMPDVMPYVEFLAWAYGRESVIRETGSLDNDHLDYAIEQAQEESNMALVTLNQVLRRMTSNQREGVRTQVWQGA